MDLVPQSESLSRLTLSSHDLSCMRTMPEEFRRHVVKQDGYYVLRGINFDQNPTWLLMRYDNIIFDGCTFPGWTESEFIHCRFDYCVYAVSMDSATFNRCFFNGSALPFGYPDNLLVGCEGVERISAPGKWPLVTAWVTQRPDSAILIALISIGLFVSPWIVLGNRVRHLEQERAAALYEIGELKHERYLLQQELEAEKASPETEESLAEEGAEVGDTTVESIRED